MRDVYLHRGLHILALLSCYISSSVIVSSSKCRPQRSFDSPSIQASYREAMPLIGGCVTHLEELLQQVHAINYKVTIPRVQHANVLVSMDPTPDRTRTRTLIVILNSDVSVAWEVELQSPEDVDVSLFRFIISNSSSLEFPGHSSEHFEVVNDAFLPSGDHELLTSVTQQFGNVTSFSIVQDADEITLSTKSNKNAPLDCNLSSSESAVTAYTIEDQSLQGCSTDRYDLANRRQIHVIELFSPKENLAYVSMSPVEVLVQEGDDGEQGARDALLILVAQSPTLWKVSSGSIEGSLTIVSNTPLEARGVRFTETALQQTSSIVATKTGLLSWAEEQYGTVMSYSHIRVANQMTVYLHGPAPEGPVDVRPTGATELSLVSYVSCGTSTLRVTVPNELVEKHGLTPGMVTWSSRDCSGVTTDQGLVLEAGIQNCSSVISKSSDDTFIVTNEVIFYSTDVTEGSGLGLHPGDDEDTQIIDRKSVSCTFAARSGTLPNNIVDSTDLPRGPLNDAVSMYLDIYTNGDYAQRMPHEPFLVEVGESVYFEMGVTRDARLNIVLGECWIGIPVTKRYVDRISTLTRNGCPVEPSFMYLPVRHPSFKDPPPPGTVKQFTFDVPNINSQVMTFYVYCNLTLCARSQIEGEERIVPCSSLPPEGDGCQPRRNDDLWPMKNLEIGPFKISSRVDKHQNETGRQLQSCSDSSGGILIPGYVFAIIVCIAFLIGVAFVASLWIITKHTRVPSSAASASVDNSAVNNGHIPNGHVPNGGGGDPPHEMQAFLPVGVVDGNRIPHEGLYNGIPQV